MCRRLILLVFVALMAGMVNSASALYLKVDFVYPEMVQGDPCFVERFDLTAKDGWFPWAHESFKDCWRHDWSWCATYPDGGPPPGGIDGTGIDFQLWSGRTSDGRINDGGKRFAAYGMQQVTDGGYATGHPLAEPIANSGVSTFDSSEKRSLVLVIQGLGPGTYYLESYHNCGWDVDDPYYNNSDPALGYYNVADVNMSQILVRGPDVTQFITPEDFPIQRERVDANLVLVTTAFIKTDVCDCNVAFMPGSGGKVMVNAFILNSGKGYARDPDPENEATNVCPGALLCWTSDDSAAEHDVYLGTDFNDVNDADTTSAEYKDTLSVGTECYPLSGLGLDLGTTYYWRIDEVNDPCLWKGDVWTFTTNDGNAFEPYPADDATKIPLDVNSFSWSAGCSAATHDVFFGTNADDVDNATTSSHPNVTYTPGATSGSYDPPGPLAYATHYYWRVDAVGSGGQRWHGKVWHFKTKSEVDDPSLLVRYQFDELPPSSIAFDSSGNESDGDIGGDPNDWDPDGGKFGGCRIFGGRCTLPADVPKTITSAITISMWLKDIPTNDDSGWTNLILDGSSNIVHWRMRIMVPSNQGSSGDWPGYILWRAGMEPNDRLSWDFDGVKIKELDGWNHWVFIKDEITQTMKIYFDGVLAASATGTTIANLASMYPNNILICGNQGGSGGGSATMDDFRIYNRALPKSEVLEVFRGGDLWSAWLPQPRDFKPDVPREVTLSWKPGDYAEFHDVYMGTSWDDVNDANTTSDEYKSRRDANTFDPCDLLELGKTYYWRIDEVNDPCLWKGKVWRFTVADFLIIDDMETYNTTDNRIYNTWEDGYGNGTGSEVSLGVDPIDPVHGGKQSLEYLYDNADGKGWDLDYYSEISVDALHANLKIQSRDWTQADIKVLTLFFYGGPENDANATEQMYVGLTDTSGAGSYAQVNYGFYGEDMNDIREEEWHQWDIALSDFTDVDESAVGELYIGFGIRGNPNPGGTPGGSGIVWFDDVRLYPPKCIPWRLKPRADLSGDCFVGMADVGEVADEWLDADAVYDLMVEPNLTGLVGWWKLDEGSSNVAADSSSFNNHGTVEGEFAWVADHNAASGGYALDLPGDGSKVRVPDAPELRPTTQVTAAAWINYAEEPGYSARIVVKGADANDYESFTLQLAGSALSFFVRSEPNHDGQGVDSDADSVDPDEWVHLAGTYDGNDLKCYVNGRLSGSEDVGTFTILSAPNDLCIGNREDANDRALIGAVDDVRVYTRALTQAEIAWLATDGTGLYLMQSLANFYDREPQGRQAVNFRDIDVLLDSWLEEKLWPPEE